MPVLNVTGKFPWVQTVKDDGTAPVYLPEQTLALELIRALSVMVVMVVNAADNSSLTVQEVITVVNTFHPWSSNTPDLWIDLQPGNGGLTGVASIRNRRQEIRDGLRKEIAAFFTGRPTVAVPQIDIEVRPLGGSGYSLKPDGEAQATW